MLKIHLRICAYRVKYDEGKLRIQCFGNFDVFVGNEKVAFKRAFRANFNLNELRAFFL